MVDLGEKCENGGDHFWAKGEGDLLLGGILQTDHESPWFVMVGDSGARGKTFSEAVSRALRNAELNLKRAQRFWDVSRKLETERMKGEE